MYSKESLVLIINILQSALAPPPVVQAPPTAESAVEPELVGDHDGVGLAVGIVSRYIHIIMYMYI